MQNLGVIIDGAVRTKPELENLLKILDPKADPKNWHRYFRKWRDLDRVDRKQADMVRQMGKLLNMADPEITGASLYDSNGKRYARIHYANGRCTDAHLDGYTLLEQIDIIAFRAQFSKPEVKQ